MNSQPNHAQIPPQPQGQISIQDVFSMYIAIASIPQPHTETLTQIKTHLENILHAFTKSLGLPGATH